jgi:proteic killer suppression protein
VRRHSLIVYRFPVYDIIVIRSFRDAGTEKIWRQEFSKKFRGIEKAALRKLIQIARAATPRDLALPGNNLEKLERGRKGQYSVRINDQDRVCFVWRDGDAWDVEITDYH